MIRMDEFEVASLGVNISKPKAKKSKYGARKTWLDGICFDSQKEANYYLFLKSQVKAGKIAGFCRQARFLIIAGVDGERGAEYVTDFVIFNGDGTYRIVDVKGVKTQEFKHKMKCLKEKYPKIKVELE